MPSLAEISEAAAAECERIVRDARAMDYAYLADIEAIRHNEPPTHLRAFIDNQYAVLAGGRDDGNSGTNPQA